MKTLFSPAALIIAAALITAGCQNSQRSASNSSDSSEVELRATSRDANTTVHSDAKNTEGQRSAPQKQVAATTDTSAGQASTRVQRDDFSEQSVTAARTVSDRSANQNYSADATVDRDRRPTGEVAASATTADPKEADNTGRNVRDRNDQTLTPGDQGGSDADVQTTRNIRRAIVREDGLSVNAKNIKIITVNGKITLRGPVNSQEEKAKIASLIKNVAGEATVDNQLEVKTANQ